LHRVLLASTAENDVVLDPFSGTGTTAAMAKRLRRHFVGIERHPDYAEAAIARVNAETPIAADAVATTPMKREAPRVPFGSLVERNFITPGTILCDKSKRVFATVSPDGTLISGAKRGSIHKLGALLTNAPSCNGWTFWHFERDGNWLPLDTLRGESLAVEANAPTTADQIAAQ
ncbi:DNA methyltransferase, partial [Acetobacter estunensis]|uniref:DNA methyltransferase n=1 Tax=Acetobacter estunensis TaxID=104097 RepID=UPI001D4872DF